MRSTGTRTPNSGVTTSRAEQRLVPLIVGMRDERDAGGNQLGPRRFDLDAGRRRPSRTRREPDAMIGAGQLAILELGLRDRGPEVDVPERRRLDLIGQPALQQAQERELRDALRARPMVA